MMLKFLKPTAKNQFQRRTPTYYYYSWLIYRSAGLFVALLLSALPRALIYRSSIAQLSLICGATASSARCLIQL
jgi:hypothetical protein